MSATVRNNVDEPQFGPQREAELRIDSRSIIGKLETCQHLQTILGGELFYRGALVDTGPAKIVRDQFYERRIEEKPETEYPHNRKCPKGFSKRTRLFN